MISVVVLRVSKQRFIVDKANVLFSVADSGFINSNSINRDLSSTWVHQMSIVIALRHQHFASRANQSLFLDTIEELVVSCGDVSSPHGI